MSLSWQFLLSGEFFPMQDLVDLFLFISAGMWTVTAFLCLILYEVVTFNSCVGFLKASPFLSTCTKEGQSHKQGKKKICKRIYWTVMINLGFFGCLEPSLAGVCYDG